MKKKRVTAKDYARIEAYLRDTTFSVPLMAEHTGLSELTIKEMARAMGVSLVGRS